MEYPKTQTIRIRCEVCGSDFDTFITCTDSEVENETAALSGGYLCPRCESVFSDSGWDDVDWTEEDFDDIF